MCILESIGSDSLKDRIVCNVSMFSKILVQRSVKFQLYWLKIISSSLWCYFRKISLLISKKVDWANKYFLKPFKV